MNDKRIIDFRYAPQNGQVCIGLIDDTFKTMVRDDGSINMGYHGDLEASYYLSFSQATFSRDQQNRGFKFRYKPEFLHNDSLISSKQDFGDPSAAIVKTVEDYNASTLEWKAFAWQTDTGARVDVLIWKMTAKENFIRTRSAVTLDILGQTDGAPEIFSCTSAKNPKFLEAGGTLEGSYFFLQSGSFGADEATLENAQKALMWCETYWQNANPFVVKFEIPDPQIMDMLKSCSRNILQAREMKEGVYSFQVGPTAYRGLWIVDGYFILESAHIMGRYQDGFNGILAVLKHVHPDGSITIMDYHEKETGISIATLVRQCELMGDDTRLKELWPTIMRALSHIKSLRAKADALGSDYPAFGMFPPSFGDGGINGPEPEYTTPLWTLVGLKFAYDAGKRLSLDGYKEFKVVFDEVLTAMLYAMDRDRKVTDDGISYVPTSMLSDEEVLHNLENNGPHWSALNQAGYKPQTGTWALSQAIAPGEVFPPNDPIISEFLTLLDSVDNTQGIPENTGWMTDNAIWAYSSMFNAEAWLYAGHSEKAVDYLYAFANHASKGRCWREEQALTGTQSTEICGDMPHNWGSAEFIRLTRNLLVLERQGNLELLAGLPEEWLPTANSALILEQTPTKYGRLDINLTLITKGNYEFTYCRDPIQTPEHIIFHWDGDAEISVPFTQSGNEFIISGSVCEFSATLRKTAE